MSIVSFLLVVFALGAVIAFIRRRWGGPIERTGTRTITFHPPLIGPLLQKRLRRRLQAAVDQTFESRAGRSEPDVESELRLRTKNITSSISDEAMRSLAEQICSGTRPVIR